MSDKMKKIKREISLLLICLFCAFTFRSLAYEQFKVPSGSMVPTLLVGDIILVKKWAYGYSSRSALWGVHLWDGRLFRKLPNRGDVIVFRRPNDKLVYVKRLIGLPGDKIQVIRGNLYVNSNLVENTNTGTYDYTRSGDKDIRCIKLDMYSELLPDNQKKHSILKNPYLIEDWHNNTKEYIVPEGKYFMMGDNRDNSMDSRFEFEMGVIPEDYLVGQVVTVICSFSKEVPMSQFFEWIKSRFKSFRTERVWQTIE